MEIEDEDEPAARIDELLRLLVNEEELNVGIG